MTGPPPPPRQTPGIALPREHLAHSVFFAIFPRPGDAERIAAQSARLGERHALKGKMTELHRLHVTLHHFGRFAAVPAELLQAALGAAATVAPPSFDVVFDEALRFEKSKAFVLCGSEGTAALAAFRQRLSEALAKAGFACEPSFTPHMTLAYTSSKIEAHPIEPIRWTADSVALVDSHVGKRVYEVLGRWPAAPEPSTTLV
ncbi:2'-5' RNA ligase [Variovorax sp. Root318D1]|uniref:2'-5' RNA ligase family protein n=1 Tax=Variovorax sp. Root318D1 TaxID=1736513 RepID=UPI0006FA1BC7|nr:2'-5' RNA ligase family protein [Variovorax sp. Root318D1]KQU90269.1 2'-5' RNA ligase [Variovorax sp. Root318D1]